MSSGIYQIRNIVNGKCYIGSAVDLKKRWLGHLNDLCHRRHHSRHLQNAFDKYGEEIFVFEVLEEVEPENLLMHEQFYLDTQNSEYNIAPTAGSPLGILRSVETRGKMSMAKTGERHPNYGKHLSVETRAKQSAANTGARNHNYGKHPSAKTRAKQRVVNTGERNPFYGKHHSKETRAKQSAASIGERNPFYGKHHSEESKHKMSDAHKTYWQKVREDKEKLNDKTPA